MTEQRCGWCEGPIPLASKQGRSRRRDSVFCGRKCRQSAWEVRRAVLRVELDRTPKRLAYADPPYPGHAWRYKHEESFAGEVDHAELIERLTRDYDGWALSTSADALRELLPLCPAGVLIGVWAKPRLLSRDARGPCNTWEAVIFWPGRRNGDATADVLLAPPARLGGTLIGRKPWIFCAWLFELLGAGPCDTLDDLFPGTGIVGRSWRVYASALQLLDASARSSRDASARARADASARAAPYASASPALDASPVDALDASASAAANASAEYSPNASAGDGHDASALERPSASEAAA